MRRVTVVVFPDPAPGQDADRAAGRLDGTSLRGIQVGEDVHRATVSTGPADDG